MSRTDKCVHYWVIDDNNRGVCKRCFAKRQFLSFDEIRSYNNRVEGKRRSASRKEEQC